MIRVRYFAWLRERVGESRETVETRAETVAALVEELRAKSPAHALAFSDMTSVRVALDEEMVDLDAPLGDAREVAFFPPMTGG
ncbi:MAG: molybdopterin converting factor subunit 1 [Pseudomonadota bacterium]